MKIGNLVNNYLIKKIINWWQHFGCTKYWSKFNKLIKLNAKQEDIKLEQYLEIEW